MPRWKAVARRPGLDVRFWTRDYPESRAMPCPLWALPARLRARGRGSGFAGLPPLTVSVEAAVECWCPAELLMSSPVSGSARGDGSATTIVEAWSPEETGWACVRGAVRSAPAGPPRVMRRLDRPGCWARWRRRGLPRHFIVHLDAPAACPTFVGRCPRSEQSGGDACLASERRVARVYGQSVPLLT